LDIPKAVGFVKKNGTALEKYRLRFLIGEEKNDEIPLQYLRSLQNEDGGFPYDGEKGRLSCVNDTSNYLGLMVELGLGNSDVCKKTIEYLFRIQGKDGGWSENEAIKQYNPPFWDIPGDLRTTMWLTASITNYLIQLGYKKSQAVQRAVGFLLKNRNEEGKFAGFLHSTWLSIGVFGQLKGSESDIVKNALKVIDQNIEKLRDGAGDFAWCLECFYVAGLTKENPTVKKCIDELVNLQQENGAWLSADGEKFTVSTTINVLRALKNYKLW
jgi:hypothetical protein